MPPRNLARCNKRGKRFMFPEYNPSGLSVEPLQKGVTASSADAPLEHVRLRNAAVRLPAAAPGDDGASTTLRRHAAALRHASAAAIRHAHAAYAARAHAARAHAAWAHAAWAHAAWAHAARTRPAARAHAARRPTARADATGRRRRCEGSRRADLHAVCGQDSPRHRRRGDQSPPPVWDVAAAPPALALPQPCSRTPGSRQLVWRRSGRQTLPLLLTPPRPVTSQPSPRAPDALRV